MDQVGGRLVLDVLAAGVGGVGVIDVAHQQDVRIGEVRVDHRRDCRVRAGRARPGTAGLIGGQ